MATLDNSLKQKLERLLEMSGGYVLDFSNTTFPDFVQTSIGFDPYDRYQGSKAVISCERSGSTRVLPTCAS